MSTVDEAYIQKLLRTINHDMSATLRSSVGFSTLILSESGDKLDDKAKKWLNLNIDQGKKTQAGLIALSEYARLYDVKEEISRCDLSVLAEQVCDKLQPEGMNVEIQLSSSISGYKSLLTDYFHQLIQNCLLHSGGSRCVISEKHDEETFSIMVADDGTSLNENKAAEALLPFRTLGDTQTVGLGLSRAKRIIEIHNGSLRLCPSESGFCVEASLPSDIANGVTLLSPIDR